MKVLTSSIPTIIPADGKFNVALSTSDRCTHVCNQKRGDGSLIITLFDVHYTFHRDKEVVVDAFAVTQSDHPNCFKRISLTLETS